MKKIISLTLLFFGLCLVPAVYAQHGGHNCGNCPHHKQHHASSGQQSAACSSPNDTQAKAQEVQGITPDILSAFPKAKDIKKEDKWTVVYDGKKNVLGYAVYSKPASNGIKGYAGETPLMIALNTKQQIIAVVMLDNDETPGFLQKVVDAGLLKSWDGLKPSKACKKKVDTVSGATYSSRSIIETLQAALKNI